MLPSSCLYHCNVLRLIWLRKCCFPSCLLCLQVGVQQQYNQHAIQLSLLVACMYTAVGVFNLGFLTNFLSHSVRPQHAWGWCKAPCIVFPCLC